MIDEFKQQIAIEVLGPEYYNLRTQIHKTILTHGFKVNATYNNKNRECRVALPQFSEIAQWKYGEEGSQSYRRYDIHKSQEIETYYQKKQEFFLLGSSNFEMLDNPGLKWKEVTNAQRYSVIRDSARRIDPDKSEIRLLKPNGLLLRGPKVEVDALKKILMLDLTEMKMKSQIFPN